MGLTYSKVFKHQPTGFLTRLVGPSGGYNHHRKCHDSLSVSVPFILRFHRLSPYIAIPYARNKLFCAHLFHSNLRMYSKRWGVASILNSRASLGWEVQVTHITTLHGIDEGGGGISQNTCLAVVH